MKNNGKIAGYNILFILVYDIILRVATNKSIVIEYSTVLVLMQVAANFIVALCFYGMKENDKGNSFLLSTFLVLIIGIGVCVTNF